MAQTVRAVSYNHALPLTPDSPTENQWEGHKRHTLYDGEWSGSPTAEYNHSREIFEGSMQQTHAASMRRKPVPANGIESHGHAPEVKVQEANSPVTISPPHMGIIESERGSIVLDDNESKRSSGRVDTPDSGFHQGRSVSMPIRPAPRPPQARSSHSRTSSDTWNEDRIDEEGEQGQDMGESGLQYNAFQKQRQTPNRASQATMHSSGSGSSGEVKHRTSHSYSGLQSGIQTLGVPRTNLTRPVSAYTAGHEVRGRTLSPFGGNGFEPGSPAQHARDLSSQRRSPLRPVSYVELLANVPYNQQVAPGAPLNNHGLQSVVGNAASLLDTKKTLNMYRANVKKTQDAAVQYEFAMFMLHAAQDATPEDGLDPVELTGEAKHILQRLADRAYPFAQYYLADGFFSGLFNKGKPDYDKAFPLFVAASKHGHAEAGYRAALCYEFGWGTTKSYPKAVQFYRTSASKNHPGAATRLGLACMKGDMGLDAKVRQTYRDGLKWLKRATESADPQYNAGPFELGLLHLTGHGDGIFKDEAYAAQLLTQAAELGHTQANFIMGQAYENGLYGLPKDAALSVHFYNGAATGGHVEGMMALCAWYMVGAEPVLDRDETEAYMWAKMAAETGEISFAIMIC